MRAIFILPIVLVSLSLLVAGFALASSEEDIVFPVAELGGCETESECRAYCDDAAHVSECVDFAEAHNLITEKEASLAREFGTINIEGPGQCTTQQECENYCNDITNIQECLAFAEDHDIMSDEELEDARKVAQALQSGAQLPGGCTNEAACELYCEDLNHISECLDFAEAAGFLHPEELREARQVARALEAGIQLPGGCRGEQECQIYCEDSANIEECIIFGEAAGFISPEEAADARRIAPLMAQGRMPGGCQSRESCESYCSEDANREECSIFFEEAGFISQEEAELFRQTGGRGPGGCEGQVECEAFCNDSDNQEVCFEFGRDHGLIPEEDLREIKEGVRQMQEVLESAPPEVVSCLRDRLGADIVDQIRTGSFLPTHDSGEEMRACFDEFFSSFEGEGEFDEEFGPHEGDELGPPPGFDEGDFDPRDFEQGDFQGENIEQFIPEEFREFLPEDINGLNPQDIERLIKEQSEEQFRAQFEPPPDFNEGDFQIEHIEQFVPDESQLGGSVINALQPLLRVIIPQ